MTCERKPVAQRAFWRGEVRHSTIASGPPAPSIRLPRQTGRLRTASAAHEPPTAADLSPAGYLAPASRHSCSAWRASSASVAGRDPGPCQDRAHVQRLIGDAYWIFGGRYVGVAARRNLMSLDQHDIPLFEADGTLHIVELKGPNIPKLVSTHRNHWIVGDDVHEAVGQAMNYVRAFDELGASHSSYYRYSPPPRFFGLSLPSSWSSPPLPSSPLLGGMLSGRNRSRALLIAPRRVVVADRRLVGDPAVRPADDFLGTLGPTGSHYKYL